MVQDGSIPCNYRIVQEGLAALLPLMSAQTFRLTVDEFERIVTERSVPVPSPAPVAAPSVSGATNSTISTFSIPPGLLKLGNMRCLWCGEVMGWSPALAPARLPLIHILVVA